MSSVRSRDYFAASLVASTVLVVFAWPSSFGQSPSDPLGDALFWLVLYALLLALVMRGLSRNGISLRVLIGRPADAASTRWALTAGVALLCVSLASLYAVFLPLSYVAPGFVQSLIMELDSPVIVSHGRLRILATVVNVLVLAVIGPFVEEVFFRGVLLPAWSRRLGARWAVIWSSLLFAALHVEIVGGFVFGVVTALAFLKTGTLWLPIVVHVTNNTLVCVLEAGDLIFFGESSQTLADLQATWWLGLAGLLGGLPLLIGVLRRMPMLRNPSVASDGAKEGSRQLRESLS